MKHNWEYKTIRNMCDNTPYRGVISSYDGKYWLLNLDKIVSGDGKVMEYEYFHDSDILDGSVTTFGKNYVLYSKLRPNLNKVIVAKDSGFCTTELVPLLPNKALNSYFLAYFLRSPIFLSYITGKVGGAKMPRAKMNEFWSYKIPVPPMEVQERIVAELDEINGLIETKREQLKQLDLLAQSIFYTTFGDPVTNPKGWPVKNFEETIKKVKYPNKLKTTEYENEGEFPIVSQEENIIAGYSDRKDCVYHITQPIVIFGDHTRCLKYINFDFALGADGVKILEPKIINARFLYFSILLCKIPSLGYSRHYRLLKELDLPVPPLALQEDFAEKVEAIEERKTEIETTIKELQTLLDSRMDYWFN